MPITKPISKRNLLKLFALGLAPLLLKSNHALAGQKPALFLIGDSTVRNGKGDNGATAGQFGWGRMIKYYFDKEQIHIVNDAMGGTSSRSFQQDPELWPNVLKMLRPNDYVMMAFGHNDSRGSLKGIGDEIGTIKDKNGNLIENVRSYGWYMREYVRQIKAKGAIPIIISLIPRNRWTENKVNRNTEDYALWAKQVAKSEGVLFIDLNEKIANHYDKLGKEKVTAEYFPPNETVHPNWAGSALNASLLISELKKQKITLNKYLIKNPNVPVIPDILPSEQGEPGPIGMFPKDRVPE